MTPFKIRKRLKKLLGLKEDAKADVRPPPREKVMLRVVDGDGLEQSHSGHVGDTPLFISGNMEKPIGSGRTDNNGSSWRVEILEGIENVSPQGENERAMLYDNGYAEHLRLACRVEILQGDARVRAFEFVEL